MLLSLVVLFIFNSDLRMVIGATAYWVLIVGTSLGVSLTSDIKINIKRSIFTVNITMLFFILSGLFSSLINVDSESAYQIMKILICFMIISILILSTERYKISVLANILFLCLFVMFISAVSTYFITNWAVVLGDGRMGTQISYPGVMWKSGAFILPIILSFYFLGGISRTRTYLAIILAFSLVLIDGSRTGFLYMAFQVPWLVYFIMDNKNSGFWGVCKKGTLFFMLVTVGFLFIFSFNLNDLVVIQRLSEIDESRIRMLSEALEVIDKCILFGCGFGSSSIETSGYKMVIHNAYLSTLGDYGLFTLLALISIVLLPFVLSIVSRESFYINSEKKAASCLLISTAGFPMLMMFHPLSSEFSEWGIFFIPIMALFSTLNHLENKNKNEKAI